jgi:hypothetical protein
MVKARSLDNWSSPKRRETAIIGQLIRSIKEENRDHWRIDPVQHAGKPRSLDNWSCPAFIIKWSNCVPYPSDGANSVHLRRFANWAGGLATVSKALWPYAGAGLPTAKHDCAGPKKRQFRPPRFGISEGYVEGANLYKVCFYTWDD